MKTRFTVAVVCAFAVGCGGGDDGTAPEEAGEQGVNSTVDVPFPVWSPAQRIDEGLDSISESPDVAVNGAGHAMIVWQQESSQGMRIRGRRFIPGLGWQRVEDLEAAGNTEFDSIRPQVTVDGEGRFYVTWHRAYPPPPFNDGSNKQEVVFAMHSADQWQIAIVDDNEDDMHLNVFNPEICVNASGIGWLFWTAEYYAPSGMAREGIGLARFDGAGGSIGVRPAPYGDEASAIRLASPSVDSDGMGWVAAIHDVGKLRVHQVSSLQVSGWTSHIIATTSTGVILNVTMARNVSGYGAVAYVERPRTALAPKSLKARRLDPMGPVGDALVEVTKTTNPDEYLVPTAAADERGDTVIAWRAWNSMKNNFKVHAGRLEFASGRMDPPEMLQGTHVGRSDGIEIQPLPGGHMLATWLETAGTASSTRIWAARRLANLGWQPPSALETGQEAGSESAMAVDAGGRAVVAWAA